MSRPVCAIVGVGPGNGAAFARRFADEGYATALLARSASYLEELTSEIEGSRAFPWDVTDSAAAPEVFAQIRDQLGPVSVLVYNAGAGAFGTIDDITEADLVRAFEVNALGCLTATKQVLPDMRRAASGNVVVIGATASVRGGDRFAAFAPAKAAQRSLAQSMARHLGRDGIHVSYVVIDGVIDLTRTRQMLSDEPDELFLQPADIAETVFHLTRQPRSAWTFELDLRPFCEKW
jgi:NADP-dependent 3-hydroxy acid dehydrogenase YdfG